MFDLNLGYAHRPEHTNFMSDGTTSSALGLMAFAVLASGYL